MNVDSICDKVALEQGLSKVFVRKMYKAYWLFVKEKINEMDFDRHMTPKEFEESRLSVMVPHIGRLACTWRMYENIRKNIDCIKEIRKTNKYERKESKAIV